MFQRILVPLDGSTRAERAIPVAARLAHASGGSCVLSEKEGLPRPGISTLEQPFSCLYRRWLETRDGWFLFRTSLLTATRAG